MRESGERRNSATSGGIAEGGDVHRSPESANRTHSRSSGSRALPAPTGARRHHRVPPYPAAIRVQQAPFEFRQREPSTHTRQVGAPQPAAAEHHVARRAFARAKEVRLARFRVAANVACDAGTTRDRTKATSTCSSGSGSGKAGIPESGMPFRISSFRFAFVFRARPVAVADARELVSPPAPSAPWQPAQRTWNRFRPAGDRIFDGRRSLSETANGSEE